jgi:acetyl esterase/lipase
VRSHTAALIVMASTARIPLLTRLVTLLTHEPRVESATVGGLCCTLVRPQGKEARGTIVFLNGGTRLGCNHPAVQRLVRGMGRAGCLVVAPELPGLKDGELTLATLEAAVEAATAAAATASTGRIVLFGVSAGGSLALLAAADSSLEGRVSAVVAIAPWAELDPIVRMATTGFYDGAPRETTPLVQHFVASSLQAAAEPGRDGRAVDELLANRDPQRFDALRAALPAEIDSVLEQLSPLRAAGRLDISIELVSAADDGYFPLAEAEKLAAALPQARLTVTSLLDHVRLRPSARVHDLVRFTRFTARSFAAAVTATKKQRRAAQPLRFLTVGAGGLCRRSARVCSPLRGRHAVRERIRRGVSLRQRTHVRRQPVLHVPSRQRRLLEGLCQVSDGWSPRRSGQRRSAQRPRRDHRRRCPGRPGRLPARARTVRLRALQALDVQARLRLAGARISADRAHPQRRIEGCTERGATFLPMAPHRCVLSVTAMTTTH